MIPTPSRVDTLMPLRHAAQGTAPLGIGSFVLAPRRCSPTPSANARLARSPARPTRAAYAWCR
eukprot:1251504-Prymnesium_polylepis.1